MAEAVDGGDGADADELQQGEPAMENQALGQDIVADSGPDGTEVRQGIENTDGENASALRDPDSTAEAPGVEQNEPLPRTASRFARPDSAQIAKLIEGYDDDFLDDQDGAAELLPEMQADEPAQDADEAQVEHEPAMPARQSVQELRKRLEIAQAEQDTFLSTNERLQRSIRSVLDLRRKGAAEDDSKLGTAEARYKSLAASLEEQKAKLTSSAAKYDRTVEELREELHERLTRTTQIQNALRHFIVEVGKGAEDSSTGKPIRPQLVEKLHNQDILKEEKLISLRLKNIELRNKLERLEQSVQEKEQLAEGLHLIDFEQLKIENQSLTEKIEERNEELLKLRRKITTTVQILTHMREKLQFVQRRVRVLTREVGELEAGLGAKRDSLSKLKQRRDNLRHTARKIRETSVYIDSPMLLQDMQAQVKLRDQLISDIDEMQIRKERIAARVGEMTQKIVSITEDMGGSAPIAAVR
eukprot:jgi/Ulvmu1/9461/UM052_0029.1